MICVRPMTAEDLALGLSLREEAGWNQTEADWRRFLDLAPHGCLVGELAGQPVGTVTTCIFDRVAWIGMMLVRASARGRGVGTALMQHALAYLDEQQISTIRLDATPQGLPIYEKLGFTRQFLLQRYGGTPSPVETPAHAAGLVVEQQTDLDAVYRLDHAATQTDRHRLLKRMFAESADPLRVALFKEQPCGYLMARPGRLATQIGPVIAESIEAGDVLLADALWRYSGSDVFVDIPTDHRPATAAARAAGLKPLRTLTRMVRGVPVVEQLDQLWASSGPEKG